MNSHHPQLTLSVLDATPIGPGVNAIEAVNWTVEIGKIAEEYGFFRFWVVEHHGIKDIGGVAPAVLLGHISAVTHTIRLGAGGIMLPNHAPYYVAEEFSLLEALCPGRIDLGIGRGGGTFPKVAKALKRIPSDPETFCKQIDELSSFLNGNFPAEHPYHGVAPTLKIPPPQMILLGTSESSAKIAAKRKLPFAYAHHIVSDHGREAIERYHAEFNYQGGPVRPHSILTVAVVCDHDADTALKSALRTLIIRLRQNIATTHGLEVSDEVLLYPEWSIEEERIARKELEKNWILVGDPHTVKAGLIKLQKETGADEIMITTLEYDGQERIRSLKAVASIFNQAVFPNS